MKRMGVVFFMMLFVVGLFAQDKAKAVEPEAPAGAKKMEIEFSFGMARVNPTDIYARAEGIDTLMGQYTSYYGVNFSASGEFKENKLLVPINVAVNYHFKNKLYFRGGIDLGFNSASSNKVYQVNWEDGVETQDYTISDKISYVMPHVGLLYRLKSFDVYGMLGLGFVSYTHDEFLEHTEPGYGHEIADNFKGKGSGLGIIVGLKYNIKPELKVFGAKFRGFIKLETMMLNIGKLTGDKTRAAANSLGDRYDSIVSGTFQHYQWNPYGTTSFPYWDVFETPPTDLSLSAAENLKLNLSAVRLMIGVSF